MENLMLNAAILPWWARLAMLVYALSLAVVAYDTLRGEGKTIPEAVFAIVVAPFTAVVRIVGMFGKKA